MALAIRWQRGGLCQEDCRRAAQLAAEKYGSPAWTMAR